ncbi:MAG TPA: adenosyl-hopene transferase HpnH [Nitrospiraceae bacterium]|jgi:hopanoid biosynthesis associated radical SAM protein HpnH|nr:adenosyl-hopene transferase HpnH [Nitrospiraceae bacterium]
MRFPISLYSSITSFLLKNLLKGQKRSPLVLMLELTHRCNLNCAGCDRIRLHAKEQSADLSFDQCIEAVLETDAPVVTITGGEPLLYQELKPLLSDLLLMKRHVYLCTNGLLAESFIDEGKPHPRLTLNFHLDGMEETHDRIVGKKGTFKTAVGALKKAKERGFRVSTNTSVYNNTDIRELEKLFELLKKSNVDGILISPAFSYESVDDNIFLSVEGIQKKFKEMDGFLNRFPLMSSPIYLDFLLGKRKMHCTPWGNPTRNPLGWKSPCYLITDAYYSSFEEMMEKTPWDRYEAGKDPRCTNCMVHSGYEATATRNAFSNVRDLFRLVAWNMKKT